MSAKALPYSDVDATGATLRRSALKRLRRSVYHHRQGCDLTLPLLCF